MTVRIKRGWFSVKRRITTYMDYVDGILQDNESKHDYHKIREEHKVQISYFIHERLVHLLVTLTFALLAFGVFFVLYMKFAPELLLLFLAVMVLLIPYVMHYFLLENGVQKMYRQYDALTKMCEGEGLFSLKDENGK